MTITCVTAGIRFEIWRVDQCDMGGIPHNQVRRSLNHFALVECWDWQNSPSFCSPLSSILKQVCWWQFLVFVNTFLSENFDSPPSLSITSGLFVPKWFPVSCCLTATGKYIYMDRQDFVVFFTGGRGFWYFLGRSNISRIHLGLCIR